MRAVRIIALVGAITVGFLVKQIMFPANKVAADVHPVIAMDILQLHRQVKATLPIQAMQDRTFVFDAPDRRAATR